MAKVLFFFCCKNNVLFSNLKILWFLHLLASCFLAEGLATEELVVAETPISELLKSEAVISKCDPRISSGEDARPFITNDNSGGEFRLFLFTTLRFYHRIYTIIKLTVMFFILSNHVQNLSA